MTKIDTGILVKTYDAEQESEIQEVTRYVSSNAPYFMTCNSDVMATFASGGELVDLHFTDSINPLAHAPPPALNVPNNSIAASNLFAALCNDARQYLRTQGFEELDMVEAIGRSVE